MPNHNNLPSEQKVFPRLLMLDSSPFGETSATGQLKAVFLGKWPVERFLQVWENTDGKESSSLHCLRIGETKEESRNSDINLERLVKECRLFSPDVIYFRPVASPVMTAFAEKIIDMLGKPVVTHIMDDWLESLREDDPESYIPMNAAVRRLLARSVKHLSICEAMSEEYLTRYGFDFIPLANAVDISDYPEKKWSERQPVGADAPFTLRYVGSLADDMTYASVCKIANVVSRMQPAIPIKFEIYVMNWFRGKAEEKLGGLPGIHVFGSVDGTSAYRDLLHGADGLVIAYNFDTDSVRHVSLSMANKMPECLASGAPLLAFGPRSIATIDYLFRSDCAVVVSVNDDQALQRAISSLVLDLDYCCEVGEKARKFVTDHHNKLGVQETFLQVMREAANTQIQPPVTPLVFPYDRKREVSFDETRVIARLIADKEPKRSVMIDVGAHFGTALKPFLDKGWQVLAFEPDERNRAKLMQMLEKHPYKENVSVDTRALSDTPAKNVVFYNSDESTGISGLSAFHKTHKVGQKVDITTLTNVLDKEQLDDIQFLKIDTEGYDLYVLRGFPWHSTHPAIIECEFEDSKTVPLGYTYHDLATFLTERGYTVYVSEWHPVIRYGIRHDWHLLNRYPCELSDNQAWGNLIAFRDSIDEFEFISAAHEELNFGQPLTSLTHQGFSLLNLVTSGDVVYKKGAYKLLSPGDQHYLACVFSGSVDAGDEVNATVSLQVSDKCTLSIMLCRNGVQPFERSIKNFDLDKGNHSLTVKHLFKQAHGSVRIQIGTNDNTTWVSNIVPGIEFPETSKPGTSIAVDTKISSQSGLNPTPAVERCGDQQNTKLRLSLVTPSLNQNTYLSSMLESVENQTVQPFEHLIFDAGSTDGSLDRFGDYQKKNPYARLYVGKDSSQTNAINLGFSQSNGDVIAWLNTDDRYFSPNVIENVLKFFKNNPGVDVVYGKGRFIDPEGQLLREAFVHTDAKQLENKFIHSVGILQPSLFMRRSVFESVGPLNEQLHYCMDYEYWIRTAKSGHEFYFIDEVFSEAILHSESKTGGQRAAQLYETAQVCQSHYGFASLEWIERLVDMELQGADGILVQADQTSPEQENRVNDYFQKFNANQEAMDEIWSRSNCADVENTLRYALKQGSESDVYVITAFNSKFFHEGLTLIAQLQSHSDPAPVILVYDLGLTIDELSVLANLKAVHVVTLPDDNDVYFEGYFSPKTYGFKSYIVWHVGELVAEGTSVLWMDAGIAAVHDIHPILQIIHEQDIFFVNHDDVWETHHLWNVTFATDACINAMDPSNPELLAPHIRAGIFGFKTGGKYHQLVRDAYQYSLNRDAICGEKHPTDQRIEPDNYKVNKEMMAALEDVEFCSTLSRKKIRKLFGFLGHRHDQSILSILAARYDAPVQSAKRHCVRYKNSSEVSKANWVSSFALPNPDFDYHVDPEYTADNAICIQHRGLFKNHQGLRFKGIRNSRAFILGNGPSLKGFDLHRLKDFDVFGMNAAYRFWDKINWYPQYYSCLDIVVGLSHAKEIKRLIEKADQYGIRMFLLRQNLIEELGPLRNQERVINFDQLKLGSELLSAPTITTGSHTTAWAAYLGYQEGFLLGIDCDYVEIIEGAKQGKGTELILESVPESNPNYFFDDYQQKGDKYNIPNPDRDIHQESWREIAERLQTTNFKVHNANMLSKVDAFDFCDIGELIETGNIKTFSRESVFLHNFILVNNIASGNEEGVLVNFDTHFPSSLQLFVDHGFTVNCFNKSPDVHNELKERFDADPRVVINEPVPRSELATGVNGSELIVQASKSGAMNNVDYLQINSIDSGMEILQAVPWERNKPAVIECHIPEAESSAHGVIHILAVHLVDLGYIVYLNQWHPENWHSLREESHRLLRYPCELDDSQTRINILAFRDPVNEEALRTAVSKLEISSTKRLKLKGLAFKSLSTTGDVPRDGDSFRLIPSSTHNNIMFAYMCMVTPGEKLAADVSFYSHGESTLKISLCRDGSTPYEAESRLVELTKGNHQLAIEHVFERAHSGARIQIGVEQQEVEISKIKIELCKGPFKVLTEPSTAQSQPPSPIDITDQVSEPLQEEKSLRTANQLFLDENYEKAIVIYLHLGKLRPLNFYLENALMCAHKMGLEKNITIEELDKRYNSF